MTKKFIAAWVSCFDESMSKWVKKYIYPGHMVVPRKPWPLGNEYHTIACDESSILFALEMVEVKDTPRHRPLQKEFSELGATVGLLLCLSWSLWDTLSAIFLDSVFCVLKGIIELRKKSVFALPLIKKRRYWQKYVDGDKIKEHMEAKEVGDVDAWAGALDGVKFHIHCLKEPDYVMSLMSSYVTLNQVGKIKKRTYEKDRNTTRKEFKYNEIVYNHFLYCDLVDAHNCSRMFPIAIEENWKTTRWVTRVFTILLAVTEVNCQCAYTIICNQPEMSRQDFRRKLSEQLMNNEYQY